MVTIPQYQIHKTKATQIYVFDKMWKWHGLITFVEPFPIVNLLHWHAGLLASEAPMSTSMGCTTRFCQHNIVSLCSPVKCYCWNGTILNFLLLLQGLLSTSMLNASHPGYIQVLTTVKPLIVSWQNLDLDGHQDGSVHWIVFIRLILDN